jgi:hypothetical protein
MTTPKVMINPGVYKQPVPVPTFGGAIFHLINKYLHLPINERVINSIKIDVDMINYQFSKQLEVEVLSDGTIFLKGEEINMPLTRKVLVEKI